jgi:hypothetical protein
VIGVGIIGRSKSFQDLLRPFTTFGASDFAEDVVEGVSGFDFGAAISGHGGEGEVGMVEL